MFRNRISRLSKWKKELTNALENTPIFEREVIILNLENSNSDFIVTYYSFEIYLCFQIHHFPKGISMLKAINNGDKITIGDIVSIKNNKGFGTILITELINYAKGNDIKIIDGWLSITDINDHEVRLFNFYRKLGFEITLDISNNKNRMYHIELKV